MGHGTDHSRGTPEVSLGLLVFNGERHLRIALDLILAQSFGGFELIIADNASTDSTPEIIREYAGRDARIRTFRHDRNIGVARNFDFAVSKARCPYFKYFSANDEYTPSLLEDCIDALRADPAAVLAFGRMRFLDERGERRELYREGVIADMDEPLARYEAVRSGLALSTPLQCGVIRTEALRRCGGMGNFPGSDIVLTAALALRGRFINVPQVHVFRRLGIDAASLSRSAVGNQQLFEPGARRPAYFAAWRSHIGHVRAMAQSGLRLRQRLQGLAVVLRHLAWDRRRLLREIGGALILRPPA
ncbi:MAG: glycosyltransferase family 2 protein [Gammaproteobacteria bacterium]